MEYYVIATPIGNLEDITFRAIKTLEKADIILCEDTRVTRRLLQKYNIQKPLLSYHQRSQLARIEKILQHLQNGKILAQVTDAGTPGLSDPGSELIIRIKETFGKQIKIIPIPGPSALTAFIQVAGINLSKFSFLGFPPNKKGRNKFFQEVLMAPYPVIYYESPYRFLNNLKRLQRLGFSERTNQLQVVVGRELTKIYEEIKVGLLEEVIQYYQDHPQKIKGEFVVAILKEKQLKLLKKAKGLTVANCKKV